MTEKLFDNGSLLCFDAVVEDVCEFNGKYKIVLDRTAFAPEGGGQYSDRGSIDSAGVDSVIEENGMVYHICDAPLEKGKRVCGVIDEQRRRRHTANHTGEHIICGLIYKKYGFNNVGFHLGTDEVTMDMDGFVDRASLREIERLANQAVMKNIPVKVVYPNEEDRLFYRSKHEFGDNTRVVVIEGIDACACCAPHVTNTGEIGMIKIMHSERYKGGTRIYIKCGIDALNEFNAELDRASAISSLISSKRDSIDEGVQKLVDDISVYRMDVNRLKNKITDIMLENTKPQNGKLVLIDNDMDINGLKRFVLNGMERYGGICAAFSGNDADGYMFVLGCKDEGFSELLKLLISKLQGKGGGRAPMAQGSLSCKKADIKDFFLD